MRRFLDEARITAQLDHPGVVPVHEMGTDGAGRVFFTMKLVKGRTLSEVFRLNRAGDPDWTRGAVLQVVIRVISFHPSHRWSASSSEAVEQIDHVEEREPGETRTLSRGDLVGIRKRTVGPRERNRTRGAVGHLDQHRSTPATQAIVQDRQGPTRE